MLRDISNHGRMRRIQRTTSSSELGMTLLELIIACAILMVLSSAALPIAKYSIIRQREAELHRDLREMRDAIDRYKDAADRNQIRVEVGSEGYPPDLETLAKVVNLSSDWKIRYLRKIPVDHMTGRDDWCLSPVHDKTASTRWVGNNELEMYSIMTV